MAVLIVCLVIVGVSLLVLGILGFGLVGHARRLQRAVATAQAELAPALAALRPPEPAGRHAPPDPAGRHRAG